jgi:hypothetical protein
MHPRGAQPEAVAAQFVKMSRNLRQRRVCCKRRYILRLALK